jgi:hypothetical protein
MISNKRQIIFIVKDEINGVRPILKIHKI